jgi:hypothetical protein
MQRKNGGRHYKFSHKQDDLEAIQLVIDFFYSNRFTVMGAAKNERVNRDFTRIYQRMYAQKLCMIT